MDDNDDTVTIGRTVYTKVRKGNQHYRIVEGKKLSDAEFSWQVMQSGSKSYFVNGLGQKLWHLPDIHQTDEERKQEHAALLARKAERERQAAQDRAAAEERRRIAAMSVKNEPFQLGGSPEYSGFKDSGAEEKNETKKRSCPCCVVQ